MCKLISGIAVLTGDSVKVYTSKITDSHTGIREEHNIRDDGGIGLRQTPIEYIPGKRLDKFADWEFVFDDVRPDWWTDDMTDSSERQLISALRDRHENFSFGGSLDLRGTQITALPDGLTVGGYLDLRDTQVTELPDGLTVGGKIYW